MTHGSLFSGIGGFDLAAEWMGWENVFHCEIAEFPRKILKYHFPKSICYEDIKKTDFTKHKGEIDIISGGFPCQPYSNAGKRKGKEDDRHLWPEMLRVIREVQPRFVVGENVSGLLTWNNGMVFHEIITDLENEGYETQAFLIPACATNAPHRRDRIWFVANAINNRLQQSFNGKSKTNIFNESEKQEFKSNSKFFKSIKASSIREFAPHSNGTEQRNDTTENIREEGEIRWGKESNVFGELRSDGITTDTESKRTWEQSSEDRGWENRRFDNDGKEGNVTDTNGIGLWREGDGFGKSKFNGKNYKRNDWENFPTQSPICGGDDGIPTQLDGITFSKWRNESIKGYGNAVVPQVVYQIFKAIEQSIL